MRISKTLFKILAAGLTVVALSVQTVPAVFFQEKTSLAQAENQVTDIVLDPKVHSTFHDTDGNGYGEFQGFGTSLCWWANRVGYSDTLTEQGTKAFYSKTDGLGMTIGRYNIGGGDDPSHDHITRSDSKVPGYAVDVTEITSESDAVGFDQYDLDAGYAWNYDWNADENQRNVLLSAAKYTEDGFLGEAFSNSPPYFMTKSGCSSGGENGADNLKENCYQAFAKYLTDVTKHLLEEGYQISSIEPANEPSNGWTYLSNKQEGCKMEPETLSGLYPVVDEKLKDSGLDELVLAGCDYGSTSDTKAYYDKLSEEAQSVIERMDIHCYSYSKSTMQYTKEKAEAQGKNLWMSEVDGAYTEGLGEMSAALGLAKNMSKQLNGLMPSAWILWDAIDIHVDADNPFDADSKTDEEYKSLDTDGFWGIAVADHNAGKVVLTKKYYGMGQYSRYIEPGDTLINSTVSDNSVLFSTAAYDPDSKKTVIVVTNPSTEEQPCHIDLSGIDGLISNPEIDIIRTSGTLSDGENWADVSDEAETEWDAASKQIQSSIFPGSITTFIVKNVEAPDRTKQTARPKATEQPESPQPQSTTQPQATVQPKGTVQPQTTTQPQAEKTSSGTVKVTAKKKSIVIKKGKQTSLVYTIKTGENQNISKAKIKSLGIKVTSSKKNVVKVVKTSLSKGKVSVKIKAKKKGTSKITLKAGKKKAVTKVKVKK